MCAAHPTPRDRRPQCTNGCQCFAPWSGPTCAELATKPITQPEGYGQSPSITSWGGNIVFYGGMYHLWVAVFGNCSLSTWGSNSAVQHATSMTPEGAL